MKITHNIVKLALTFGLVAFFWACEQEAINDIQGNEEAVSSEAQDETRIWEELDILHAQVQEELNTLPLPENPSFEKIPNPFLPLIHLYELPYGPVENVNVRAYKGDPSVRVDWLEDADLRYINATSSKDDRGREYYEIDIRSHNFGDKGLIYMSFDPYNDNVWSGGCVSERHYRFLVQRLEGETWVTLKDESETLPIRYFPIGDATMSEIVGDGNLSYFITDNEQRNKWYRLTVYAYANCPGEPAEWRYTSSHQYFQKFDPGF